MRNEEGENAMADRAGTEPSPDFAVSINRGMRRVSDAQRVAFRDSEADELSRRLDEFDAVRTRGDVESRSARLGTRSSR